MYMDMSADHYLNLEKAVRALFSQIRRFELNTYIEMKRGVENVPSHFGVVSHLPLRSAAV